MSELKKLTRTWTPHLHQGRYYNYPGESLGGLSFKSAQMLITSYINRLGIDKSHLTQWHVKGNFEARSEHPSITWIGHATFLIQVGGLNILTDPIFSHASLLFRRIMPPGIAPAHLPPIDYILISHNHLDHMDKRSLHAVRDVWQPTVLVPQGNKRWFDRHSYRASDEFTWWQSYSAGSNQEHSVRFTFLPAFHWSQRGIFDRNKTLWGSWLIEYRNHRIYFAGDTAYNEHFKEIKERCGPSTIALMPIGPCEPHSWMKHSHMSAAQAGQAFLDLEANAFVPMHWGTFYFGVDSFLDPIVQLRAWWKENEPVMSSRKLHEAKIGQTLLFL